MNLKHDRLSLMVLIVAAGAFCVLPSAGLAKNRVGHGHHVQGKHRDHNAHGKSHHKRARYRATVTRTSYGIPHIKAHNWAGLGFGVGHAYAKDNLCTMADDFVTLRAQRSRYFGPDGATIASAKGSNNNLASDLFWKSVRNGRVVRKLVHRKPPIGPQRQVKAMLRGWTAGYNTYLRKTGVNHITDPRCRGESWVKPIKVIDAWRRIYELTILASSGQFIDEMADTEPPAPASAASTSSARPTTGVGGESRVQKQNQPAPNREAAAVNWWQNLGDQIHTSGSNGVGLGSKATKHGDGVLLANPHFPWIGTERFYQFQLTLPGKMNVQGSSLAGMPVVNIGFNRHVAWTHTVSTAWRFTPFQLKLAPGDPTSYIYDGKTIPMTSRTVHVKVRTDSGMERRGHTFWYSRFGPVVAIPQALFSWSPTTAYALGDANADNVRAANSWFRMNRAKNVEDLVKAQSSTQGNPWVNTLAVDDKGRALYQDNTVVPNVSKQKIATCIPTGIPQVVYGQAGIITLDGSTSACGWGSDKDAVRSGIMGPHNLPIMIRRDYVQNSNDSYWMTNPKHPLTGFSPIIGDEGTHQLGLRTRYGIRMIQDRLAGKDGLAGDKFTVNRLRRLWQRFDSEGGILVKDQLADLCEANPIVTLDGGEQVDVSAACPVIRSWDARATLDSKGEWLFSLWYGEADALFSDPFDPSNPVTTPSVLDSSPANIEALGLAVKDLRDHGLPLDASPRQAQFVTDHGKRIPIPGCDTGCYAAIYPVKDPEMYPEAPRGYPKASSENVKYGQVYSGSSTVMMVRMTPKGPRGSTILTYSESENPRSRHHADQTRLFSRGKWVPVTFTRHQIHKRAESVRHLRGR